MNQLSLPIVSVTLMEDRASVRRRTRVELEAGSHRFQVPAVSPVIADKTLQGRVCGSAGKVLDLRVIRRPRAAADRPTAESQALWEQVRSQREQVENGEREMSRLAVLLESLQTLVRQWGHEVARDASFAKAEKKAWQSDWQALRKRLLETSERHTLARQSWVEQRRKLDDLTRQYELLNTPRAEMEATLELTLVLPERAEVELSVEYCVPNACWRPYHVAEWSQAATLRFRCQACVWQNTGESWDDAQLFFSTERSTLGTEPPELQADVLGLRPKQKRTVVTTREETVHVLEESFSSLPGIDTGGQTLSYTSPERHTVPTDGRPHRVPLFEFEAPFRQERVLMGELSREVLLRTRLENPGPGPLLAGPVDLIKSCGLVGRGYLEYAAPGQTFTIGWGPHPELRAHRQARTLPDEKTLLSGWRTREHEVEIHLSNLGASAQHLEVLERIPVSELKSVKVEQDLGKTTGRVAADKDGFLSFSVELAPYGRQTLTVGYLLSRKKDVEGL